MESILYKFKVEAFDPGGKIGEGEHTRDARGEGASPVHRGKTRGGQNGDFLISTALSLFACPL